MDNACPPDGARGIQWNWTNNGVSVKKRCPHGAVGEATRDCYDNKWSYPDLSKCISIFISSLNQRVSSDIGCKGRPF